MVTTRQQPYGVKLSRLQLDDGTTTGRLGSKDNFLQLITIDLALLDALLKVVGLDCSDELCSVCLLDERYSASAPTCPSQPATQSPLLLAFSNQSV